jgi:hypothetical protein
MPNYMSQIPPEPKPKPRKIKPQPRKIKPSPKMDKDLRNIREMPKRIPKAMVPKPAKGTKGSFDDALRTQNNQREILGSTKAQRAASALDLMNDMRSRNILRAKKKKK